MATTSSEPTVTTARGSSIMRRVGLVLAGLLTVADIATWVPQFADGPILPAIAVTLGVATLAAIPFAWRGHSGAAIVAVGTRVVASLGGLPAFFVPDVPATWVILAALGIGLSVLSGVLVLGGRRR